MTYLVLLVLISTAVLFGTFSNSKAFNRYIRRKKFKKLKMVYIIFCLIFISISIIISSAMNESLGFLNLESPYSTGAWAGLYMVAVYVFLFEKFHLNTFIVSKEIEWKEITDIQLFKMMFHVSVYILSNDMNDEMKRAIIDLMINQINSSKPCAVVESTNLLEPSDYKYYPTFKFDEITFYVEDERIKELFTNTIALMALKN